MWTNKEKYCIIYDMFRKILIGLNIFLIFSLWIIAVWRYRVSADFIPLHYTIYFGFDRFGPRYDLFLFPSLASVILFLNFAIVKFVVEDNGLWRTCLYGVTFLMQFSLLASFILIVLKNSA